MPFVFRQPIINGHTLKTCGCRYSLYSDITKDDRKIPKVPKMPERKIADKRPQEPEWAPIHRAADGQMPQMENQILLAAQKTQDNTNKTQMVLAARAGDRNRLAGAIPFNDYDETIVQSEDNIRITFNEAGAAMIIHLPPTLRAVRFDSTTERARAIVAQRGADLVKEIGQETQNAIRQEIDKAFGEGLGADRTADNIVNLIGLNQRQAAAVTNFRRKSLERGASIKRVQRDAQRYAQRLREYRAMVIARTELMAAANQGHLEMLRQGVDQGIIPNQGFRRVWITTPDDRLCPWCEPMDGQEVPLDGFFGSGLGQVLTPPLHQQCRCVTGTVFDFL